MIQEFAIGVIGDPVIAGVPLQELALGPLRVRRAAPSSTAAPWTPPSGAEASLAWQDVVADDSLRAIVFTSPAQVGTDALLAGLLAGKIVFCTTPPARDAATLRMLARAQRDGGGQLLCPNAIVDTEPGRMAREAVRSPEFGVVHSVYVAVRAARQAGAGTPEPVLASLGWQPLEFVLSCLKEPLARVHAIGGRLFQTSGEQDTVVAIIEAQNGAVITAEISSCLPASEALEVELDFVGAKQALRLEPFKSFYVTGPNTRHALPLLDSPAAGLVAVLAAALRGEGTTPGDLDRHISIAELLDAIEASLRSRLPVDLAATAAPGARGNALERS